MNAMMSRFSSGVMFASLNTGIDCGPVSIASYMCVGVVSHSVGRELALRERTARADGVVAHRAVGAEDRHAVGDVAERGVDLLRGRDGGAGTERGDVRGELVDLLLRRTGPA